MSYLVQAGLGQLALYSHERPLQEVIDDPRTTEKVRERLKWIPEIKKLVESELGVKATSNYTTFVQLDRPSVIWSLTVAEPYEVKVQEWGFPFFGKFPYLGFFHKETAERWAKDHQDKGLDTYVRGVSAYSTLGYLRDPLLSSMLSRSKADMVNLIYHESTHGQIYLKGQVALNEQIASYIGDYGEKQFIERTAGSQSAELREWEGERADRRRFGQMLHEFAEQLKKHYAETSAWPEAQRKGAKEKRFADFGRALETEAWKGKGMGRAAKLIVNNASLLAFLTYEDDQSLFDTLDRKCASSLRAALKYLKVFEEDWKKLKSGERPEKAQEFLRQRLNDAHGPACTA